MWKIFTEYNKSKKPKPDDSSQVNHPYLKQKLGKFEKFIFFFK